MVVLGELAVQTCAYMASQDTRVLIVQLLFGGSRELFVCRYRVLASHAAGDKQYFVHSDGIGTMGRCDAECVITTVSMGRCDCQAWRQ